jgi:penicillin-binding protein 2B
MPSIIGWSKSDVNRLGKLFKLNISSKGSGFVTSQSIKEDSELRDHDYLTIELNKPNGATDEEKDVKVDVQE